MNDSDLDALLRALPARDIAPARAARVRARAHRALRPSFSLGRALRHVVAPTLLAGGITAYLAWAFTVAASAYGG